MTISPTLNKYLVQPVEKAGTTFVEVFVVILLATGSASAMVPQQWAHAADIAGFSALVSLATTLLTFAWVLTGWLDLAVRVVKTFLQSFVGVLVAGQVANLSHADWKAALATAVSAAFLALLKGLAGLANVTTPGASIVPDPTFVPDPVVYSPVY